MSFLTFNDVHKSYGDTMALRGVSLEVREGEVFGLLGPNGAGKTTLIRILMDIIRADAGSVTLFGVPRNRDQLDRIGYLPEDRGLYTKQKVLDVMTYFGTLKGLDRREARARSRHWLERMSLSETADWRVERLSKGMGQKVQIASTLLGDPSLCVLDEPFAGLDPVNVRLVRDLIQERRQQGWTTVLSTHQMNQVEALCDRVALINRGKMMVYGRVDDVRERYSSPEVLVRLDGEPPHVPGVKDVARAGNSDWHLRLEEGVAPADVLRLLIGEGARVKHFERFLVPMEEIFIQVVQKEEQP
jgi:ABC-2 type transport system ATP-binding protein